MVVKIMVPFLGPLNTRCHIMLRTQKGTIILTTTYVSLAASLCFRGLFWGPQEDRPRSVSVALGQAFRPKARAQSFQKSLIKGYALNHRGILNMI